MVYAITKCLSEFECKVVVLVCQNFDSCLTMTK